MIKRGYIHAAGIEQNEFACFDIETLERANSGDDASEAHLSLVSIAVCDTINRTTWFQAVSTSGRESNENSLISRDCAKQNLGKQIYIFYNV